MPRSISSIVFSDQAPLRIDSIKSDSVRTRSLPTQYYRLCQYRTDRAIASKVLITLSAAILKLRFSYASIIPDSLSIYRLETLYRVARSSSITLVLLGKLIIPVRASYRYSALYCYMCLPSLATDLLVATIYRFDNRTSVVYNAFVYFEMPAPYDNSKVALVTSLLYATRVSRQYEGYNIGDLLLKYIVRCYSCIVTLRWLGVSRVDLVRQSRQGVLRSSQVDDNVI